MGMTSLLQRTPPQSGSEEKRVPSSSSFRLPVNPRHRRSVLGAASAVVVFVSVGVFAHLYSNAGRQTAVLVVTHPIQQGQVLTAADLGQTSVAVGPGVASIPVAEAPQVLGKVAALSAPTGSLLTPGDVSSMSPIPVGDAVVGLALKDGQLPADGLEPGDQVMVVETGALGSPLGAFVGSSSPAGTSSGSSSVTSSGTTSGASSGTGSSDTGSSDSGPSQDGSPSGGPSGVLVPDAVVFNTAFPSSQSSGDASELVSLELANSVAPAVSTAAAANQVSLVLVPGGSQPLGRARPASSGPLSRSAADHRGGPATQGGGS